MVARRKRPPAAHEVNDEWDDAALRIIQGVETMLSDKREPAIRMERFNALLKAHPRGGKGLFSKSQLIAVFRKYKDSGRFDIPEVTFLQAMQMRPTRTQSGVVPVTVFTKPFPCPGKCVFCPNDVRMPKSYLSDEPGAQRAEDNYFDPYLQTWNRLLVFRNIGHPVNKVELIVLGGTWSFYDVGYQYWFVLRCFEAINDFGVGRDMRSYALSDANVQGNIAPVLPLSYPRHLDGRSLGRGYNSWVEGSRRGSASIESLRARLQCSHIQNEKASIVCVGLSVETRPDYVCESELVRLRELGCTKIQIGVQSTSESVLEKIKRGHDVRASKQAIDLARRAGFKVHVHWMCNLVGGDPEADRRDFYTLFESEAYRPDELKLYPCSLVPSAELMEFYEQGKWQPYDHSTLVGLVSDALLATPRYCRLSRVIRDIPSGDIVVGNKQSNLREVAEKQARGFGGALSDIRARQIRGSYISSPLEMKITTYSTCSTTEFFLEYVTLKDQVVAFLRLSLPQVPSFIQENAKSAIVREVHVYGGTLRLGERTSSAFQHQGLGKALISKAKEIATERGFSDLAVISAVGTREYYRSLGFSDGVYYQHHSLV